VSSDERAEAETEFKSKPRRRQGKVRDFWVPRVYTSVPMADNGSAYNELIHGLAAASLFAPSPLKPVAATAAQQANSTSNNNNNQNGNSGNNSNNNDALPQGA